MMSSLVLCACIGQQVFGEGPIIPLPLPRVVVVPKPLTYAEGCKLAMDNNLPLVVFVNCSLQQPIPCEYVVCETQSPVGDTTKGILVMRPNAGKLWTLGTFGSDASLDAIDRAANRDWVRTPTGYNRRMIFDGPGEALDRDEAIILVTASWCWPCQAYKPTLVAIAAEKGTPLYVVDFDKHRAFANQLSVTRVPTTIMARKGVLLGRVTGNADRQTIVKLWAR